MPSQTVRSGRVNAVHGSLAMKAPVRFATTAPIVLAGLGLQAGGDWRVTLTAGDRILVTSQADLRENGVYAADTSYWKRTTDFDGGEDALSGTLVPVTAGGMGRGIWAAYGVGVDPGWPIYVTYHEIEFRRYASGGSGFINVKDFGATGDGLTDDYPAILDAIEYAEQYGGRVYWPSGEYYISGTLPIYPGSYFFGDGPAFPVNDIFTVTDVLHAAQTDVRLIDIYLSGYGDEDFADLRRGDLVRVDGCANDVNNGALEFYSWDADVGAMRILSSVRVDDTEDETGLAGATLSAQRIRGGSILRFRSLADYDTVSTRFFDADGVDRFTITDMGFVGPGKNAVGGAELRFRRSSSTALSAITMRNLSIDGIPGNGLVIENPIASTFEMIKISDCAGDGLVFEPSDVYGGSSTSTTLRSIYANGVRRGLVLRQNVYNVLDACVVEGATIGYYMQNCSALTINSCASETIKSRRLAGGNGVTFWFDGCFSIELNSLAVFYNTEFEHMTKCAVQVIRGPSYRPFGNINAGRFHNSTAPRVPVLAEEHTSGVGYVWLNVADDRGFVAATETAESTWSGTYWRAGRQILLQGSTIPWLNERHEMSGLAKLTYGAVTVTSGVDPAVTDDGYAVGSVWLNNVAVPNKYWVCLRQSPGAALWAYTEETWVAEVETYAGLADVARAFPTEAYAWKIGRNVGADIVTSYAAGVLESQGVSSTALDVWVNVEDYLPVGFDHSINLGVTNSGFDTDLRMTGITVETVDSVAYIKATFNGAYLADEPDFVWTTGGVPVAEAEAGVRTRLSETYRELVASLVYYDEAEHDLNFYFLPTEFITTTYNATVANLLDSSHVATGVNPSAVVAEESTITGSAARPLPTIKVSFTGLAGVRVWGRRRDYGLFNQNGYWGGNTESAITVSNGNQLRVFDPVGVLGSSGVISGALSWDVGGDTETVYLPDADKYDWNATIDQNARVWLDKTSSPPNQDRVVFLRSSTTVAATGRWWAYRKVAPGYIDHSDEPSFTTAI